MRVDVKNIITENVSRAFIKSNMVKMFYIDKYDNLQTKPVNDSSNINRDNHIDLIVEVGHISDMKLKHIKNMIKFPDIVNIEEILYDDGELADTEYVVDFLLNGIYLVNIDGKRNWLYMSGIYLGQNKNKKGFSKEKKYLISSHVAK